MLRLWKPFFVGCMNQFFVAWMNFSSPVLIGSTLKTCWVSWLNPQSLSKKGACTREISEVETPSFAHVYKQGSQKQRLSETMKSPKKNFRDYQKMVRSTPWTLLDVGPEVRGGRGGLMPGLSYGFCSRNEGLISCDFDANYAHFIMENMTKLSSTILWARLSHLHTYSHF